MKIFISYAYEDKKIALKVEQALVRHGHDVFLDRTGPAPGQDYFTRSRGVIYESDFFVFLISPDSVAKGSYPLSELEFAKKKWPNPAGNVLPVMVRPTAYYSIDKYLTAGEVLEPRGDVAFEVFKELEKVETGRTTSPSRFGQLIRGFVSGLEETRASSTGTTGPPPVDPLAKVVGVTAPLNVFISYSHRDEKMRKKLGEHLSTLELDGLIRIWHDREIGAGEDWEGEINKEIAAADIILLLVSQSFVSSRYCRTELQRALKQRSSGKAVPIPIILRPCDWISVFNTERYKIQALPRDNRP